MSVVKTFSTITSSKVKPYVTVITERSATYELEEIEDHDWGYAQGRAKVLTIRGQGQVTLVLDIDPEANLFSQMAVRIRRLDGRRITGRFQWQDTPEGAPAGVEVEATRKRITGGGWELLRVPLDVRNQRGGGIDAQAARLTLDLDTAEGAPGVIQVDFVIVTH